MRALASFGTPFRYDAPNQYANLLNEHAWAGYTPTFGRKPSVTNSNRNLVAYTAPMSEIPGCRA